jgi:hypothetical protein
MYLKTKTQIIDVLNNINQKKMDFSSIFISPAWYTILKTYIDNNKDFDIKKLSFSSNTNSFLHSLWFFNSDDYCISTIKRNKILPLETINSQDWSEIDVINNNFRELLGEFLWNNNKLLNNISLIIWELLNNISHHSWWKDLNDNTGDVMIYANYQSWQYYNWKNFVQISIVDSWVWILASVRKKEKLIEKADDAIRKALEVWFTWWTILDNKSKNFSWITNHWIWLSVTYDTLKELKWDLFIWTSDCLFSYDWKENKEYFDEISKWKWTFIIFNIYTDWNTDVDFSKIKKDLLWKDWIIKNIERNIDFW